MDRGTWVVTVDGETYMWPRGEIVQVFGFVEYTRRLSGETREAHPYRSIVLSCSFEDFDAFRTWCRAERWSRAGQAQPQLPLRRQEAS